ncbi:MAG: hypothetical protein RLZ55_1190 [Actinomycetota bacterium]
MTQSAWTRKFYPREGDGVGFDRVVFFSDAVFAIALTLAAVEIGLPEVEGDPNLPSNLLNAVLDKGGIFAGFVVAFVWVAIYWRANQRFTMTLRGMSGTYVNAVLVYLVLIAFLPIPAATLGEYWSNPAAIALFAIYGSLVSTMEVVLLVVADRGDLFTVPLTSEFRRTSVLGSLTPVVGFLTSIPLAFVSPWLALLWWVVASVGLGAAINRFLPSQPPVDPQVTSADRRAT